LVSDGGARGLPVCPQDDVTGADPVRAGTGRPLLLAVLLAGAGLTHFASPRPYDTIVPRALPGSARLWTYASGAAELAVAAAVASRRARRPGALAAAGLFAAVFPANVQMAAEWRHRPAALRAIAYGRLPLQVPLIWWALKVRRGTSRAGARGSTLNPHREGPYQHCEGP
jgi:uncharacterized membrane protein